MVKMTPPRLLCCLSLLLLNMFLHIGAQLTSPGPTCPGQEAVFTCLAEDFTGSGAGVTDWRVDGDMTTQCLVRHDGSSGNVTCGPNGAFTAVLQPGGNGTHFTSTLTVTATLGLNGAQVQCRGVANFDDSIRVIDPPALPDSVKQNRNQDMVDGTTVINWQPATVNSASNSVTYTVTSGSDLIMDFDNTTTTATVRLPEVNTDYSFCVDAVNVCGATSDKPKCAMRDEMLPPPRPVRIEVEDAVITLNVMLKCSLEPLNVLTSWDIDTDPNGNILRLPVTSLNVACNSVSKNVTEVTEFTFTDANCVNGPTASIELTANGRQLPGSQLSVYRTPVMSGDTLLNMNQVICIKLNSVCKEATSFQGFTAEMKFEVRGVHMTVVNDAISCNGETGFRFTSANFDKSDIIATVDIKVNGTTIQTLSDLSVHNGGGFCTDSPLCWLFLLLLIILLSLLIDIILHAVLVYHWNYVHFLCWSCCCSPGERREMNLVLAVFVYIFYLTFVTTVILISYMCYLCCCESEGDCCMCCCNSKGVPGEGDNVGLKEGTLSHEQELPTYQDPGEIKRQPAPDSHDVYTVPEKPKKKKAQAARVEEISAEEAGPMYQDPDTINRQPAPESGQLYTVVEPTKKASRRKPPGAPAKTEAELAEMYSTPDKSRQQEGVNYTDLSLPGSSAPPSSQGGVQYSQVRM